MLHIDLWQNCQSGISGTGCSSCVNRKTAHMGWQCRSCESQLECVGLMKL